MIYGEENTVPARLLTTQVAHFLRTHYEISQAGPGRDVVLTVSSGQSRLPCLFFGVVAAGGIYAGASPSSTPVALASLAREAGPARLLVCSWDMRDAAVSAAEQVGIPLYRVLVLTSYPELSLQSADGSVRCDFTSRGDVLQWTAVTDPEVLACTPVCLIYSSGTTTGAPKGVLLSHANMVAEAFLPSSINRRAWASKPPLNNDDAPPLGPGYRTLAHLPPAHISGVQGYFVNPLLDGGIVYWMPTPAAGNGFDMAAFLRYNEALGITSFFTAPPIYEALAKCVLHRPGLVGERTFKSLRVAYSGGTRLRLGGAAAAAALRGRMGDPEGGRPLLISQTFGATETTGAATHTPPDRAGWDTLGSVGELLPNVRMRLVDGGGRDVPVGMPGEALLKGPVMMGYHKNPEANAAVFTEDGWFRTGDVLRVVDGLVYHVDRKQDVITYKGRNVYPSEHESILLSHPEVVDAAVIGVPELNQGHGDCPDEVPRGFVVLAPNAGRAHGSGAKAQVHGSVAFYTALFQQKCDLDWAAVTREADKYVARLGVTSPRYLDEIRGIADGAGVGFLDVLALNVRTEIIFGIFTEAEAARARGPAKVVNGVDGSNGVDGQHAGGADFPSDGCTSLAFASPSVSGPGGPPPPSSFLAQNWDWQPAQAPNLIVIHISQPNTTETDGIPDIAMVTEAGIIGKIGLNAAGVGVCLNAIRARGLDSARLPVHFALRAVLESASRADALATLTKLGGVAGSAHILVADPAGSVGLEFAGGGERIGEIGPDEKGRVVHTNHLVLEHPGVEEPGWLPDSGERLARIRKLTDGEVLAGKWDVKRVVELFKDEEGFPFSINRLRVKEGESQTLFTIVMDLGRKEALVKVGRPTGDGEEIHLGF
ncbi:hypothetical protein INS49_014288 [Diaporthe citri]|uniref:uncharacterized protein n=1 Tax=Diaporthe citri TaxID=83186 RepID=UPI001C819F43|nr:uncharacterized protein INS49_014288 [Diaporthe citri]KAG6358404.1 hypothetical protein INS49_014288 [Diaporthe citri]